MPAHPFGADRRDMVRELTFDEAEKRFGPDFDIFEDGNMHDPITCRLRRVWPAVQQIQRDKGLSADDALTEVLAESTPPATEVPELLQRQAG